MNIEELDIPTSGQREMSKIELVRQSSTSGPASASRHRPIARKVTYWIRRTHLYLGLFLFPWAVLYGVSGFLFNHPTAFSDQKSQSFTQSDLAGTSLSPPFEASSIAADVVQSLKQRASAPSDYRLIDPEKAAFVRDLASVTVKAEGRKMTVFLDALGRGGTIYSTATEESSPVERPSFAVGNLGAGSTPKPQKPSPQSATSEQPDKLVIERSVVQAYKESVPALLTKMGYPSTEATVGFVPDLVFHMEADGRKWSVTYNPLQGSVTGRPLETAANRISIRRFLTRLHTAHQFPYSMGARWVWAVFVDVMSFVLVFWALSGLLMWWQIKMTRSWGWLALTASLLIASILAMGMWQSFQI
jgi:hypothetical protein